MEPSVTIMVFVENKGDDPCGFLDEHWSKELQTTGTFKRDIWRCSRELESLERFEDYQPWFAEQLGRRITKSKIDVDVGVFLPTGYLQKSFSFTSELSAALTDVDASFKFSLYECEPEKCS